MAKLNFAGKNGIKHVWGLVKKTVKDSYTGWLFVLPLVIGLLVFTFIPMFQSLMYCFYEYDGVRVFRFIGFENFVYMFTVDRDVPVVIANTFLWTILSVPVNLVLSYAFALFVNMKTKGMRFFRILYYLPVVIPGVVSALLWKDVFDPVYGIANSFLMKMGVVQSSLPRWFESEDFMAMVSLLLMSLWGIGGGMVLWLAALKAVPESLYESARLDGANAFVRCFVITIPMCSAMIFYNLLMSIIGSLQNFTTYIVAPNSGKGNGNSLYLYAVKIYNTAFSGYKFEYGYASALAWFLFLIIAVLTVILFSTSRWVYYGEEN